MEPITLNVPTSKKNQVEFKTFKLYVEGDYVNTDDIWLANISFTKENEESGI